MIDLTIDGVQVTVPEGTLVVDAAKQIGINIPVFCYHPKMEPVGMCRMCLVEIGRPVIDRATNAPQLDEQGQVVIKFGPKLETACTTPVSKGMVVVTESKPVAAARREILEFLLTSHPLDCPICDKGGECPLQNLTMKYAKPESDFNFEDKKRLSKHVALGDFIILDRERCIQCGRCVRFQAEIVDDPVIGFYHRGRSLEIMTNSDPGFDSIFSGNVTDICPVGALTTRDFRFGARPWEMNFSPSICDQCPVGCNIVYNVRREAKSGGLDVVKRVMPRQNELVNEIWICDKGRVSYHYAEAKDRLTQPMLKVDEEFVPISWEDAYTIIERKLVFYGADMLTVVGGGLANEDLFNFAQLTSRQGGRKALYSAMAGGELTTKVGLGTGSDLGKLGKGDVIVVAACDLHQEAPVWWLRVKAAAERGATVITVNGRPTRLDKFATHTMRYAYGEEVAALKGLLEGDLAQMLRETSHLVVFYGSDGLSHAGSREVARACAQLLVKTGHYGTPNNGLVGVWDGTNLQAAWEMGYQVMDNLPETLSRSGAVIIAGVDPVRDDPRLAEAFASVEFTIVFDLFLNETARLADLVLPVQAHTEREGTFTSGERRVQRFYPAVPALGESKPDYEIVATIASRLGRDVPLAPAQIMERIGTVHPAFAGITYAKLAQRVEQEPFIGRTALYYSGTGYDNTRGIGIQLPAGSAEGEPVALDEDDDEAAQPFEGQGLKLVPVTRLSYRHSMTRMSELRKTRLAKAVVTLHPETAARLGLVAGDKVSLNTGSGPGAALTVALDEHLGQDIALVPRGAGLTAELPASGVIEKFVTPQVEPQPVTE